MYLGCLNGLSTMAKPNFWLMTNTTQIIFLKTSYPNYTTNHYYTIFAHIHEHFSLVHLIIRTYQYWLSTFLLFNSKHAPSSIDRTYKYIKVYRYPDVINPGHLGLFLKYCSTLVRCMFSKVKVEFFCEFVYNLFALSTFSVM